MFDRKELAALAAQIQIQTPLQRKRPGFKLAALFASQVLMCALILHGGYHLAGVPGVYWAIISAVLVLQPGVAQSLSASAVRIAANLIGALTGLVIGFTLGTDSWQILTAMVVVIFICEPLRLDYGLRTACVTVIIVMTAHGGLNVLTTSIERFAAVVVGCSLAMLVQMAAEKLCKKLGWQEILAPPPSASAIAPASDPKPQTSPKSTIGSEE